ncbi:uncharacterized protein LOC119178475 isoform X4 [Rhipicephalus microplus]|uniref:uncharacterized protein LOC119178475 isoform X4 n=1 Tax=Rhipicephalus microplus TaxID=6941 RepID=UPI003F6A5D2B
MHTTNAYLPWFYHYGFVSFARCRETPSASRCRGEGGGDKLFFSFLRFREPVLESFSQRLRFFRGCNLCLGRKDAGGLGTAQQRLHTSEQPPCYPDYKARRGNGPTKRTVMFCCFYGWESLKKDDDPALYDKGGYRWRLYGRKAHGEAATPCYKFASCFPRRLKIPKSKMKLQRHRKPCAVCLWI